MQKYDFPLLYTHHVVAPPLLEELGGGVQLQAVPRRQVEEEEERVRAPVELGRVGPRETGRLVGGHQVLLGHLVGRVQRVGELVVERRLHVLVEALEQRGGNIRIKKGFSLHNLLF